MAHKPSVSIGHVVGIIAEYNPFHNGHAFHIQEAKRLCNASYCIVVMSGDFVQRGQPAIFDKYARTFMALSSGADLVVELPPAFALAGAEDFASCGIALLDSLGVVSHVCFGSECGTISPLMELARILVQEPKPFQTELKRLAASGLSYPKARQAALSFCLSSCQKPESIASLLSSPNNILGVEYLKAIIRKNSHLVPVTIRRQGAGYHEESLSSEFSSATAIRRLIFDSFKCSRENVTKLSVPDTPFHWVPAALKTQIPSSCLDTVNAAVPISVNDFSLLLSYRLLENSGHPEGLEKFADVSPELALRMSKYIFHFSSFEDRIADLKTRQYTYTRISRCLMHILLNISKEDIGARKRLGYATSIRILGFRRDSAPLLGAVKREAKLPLVTKTADAPRILSPDVLKQFQQDLFCSHVYQSVAGQKSRMPSKNEYTHSVIIV